MRIRPIESNTGTVHVINRYEQVGDGPLIAITACGREFEVDETVDYVDVDESGVCGRCA